MSSNRQILVGMLKDVNSESASCNSVLKNDSPQNDVFIETRLLRPCVRRGVFMFSRAINFRELRGRLNAVV